MILVSANKSMSDSICYWKTLISNEGIKELALTEKLYSMGRFIYQLKVPIENMQFVKYCYFLHSISKLKAGVTFNAINHF